SAEDAQVGVELLAVGVDDDGPGFLRPGERQRRLAGGGRSGDQFNQGGLGQKGARGQGAFGDRRPALPSQPSHESQSPALPDRAAVIAALDAILDPRTGQGLVAAGLAQGLTVTEDRAGFVMEVPAGQTALYAPGRDAAEAAPMALPGKIG